MDETFGRQIISLKKELAWPPHLPDLNPFDNFPMGFLKK